MMGSSPPKAEDLLPAGKETPQKLVVAQQAPAGALDPTFGSGEILVQDVRPRGETYIGMTQDHAGQLLIAGYERYPALLVRLVAPE